MDSLTGIIVINTQASNRAIERIKAPQPEATFMGAQPSATKARYQCFLIH